MDRSHILGMVCGYYLSRWDRVAYEGLGYGTQQATHDALGKNLDVPAASIKNWRDEFDPVHDNPRQGWHKREMYPTRRRTIEALGHLTEEELRELVRNIASVPNGQPADGVVGAIGDTEEIDGGKEGVFGLRGPTGVKAEKAFERFHAESGKPAPGTLLDRRYDQCGYDYEIDATSGRLCVEVKGLAGSSGGITFTNKEWMIAREMGDSYFLAMVRNVATEPDVSLLRNPADQLSAKMRTYTTVQTDWSVAQRTLRTVEDEFFG
jgi:Protein NO VEIN, C-terminal